MNYREWKCQTAPGGLRLHVRSWGEEHGGTPLVISHGFLEQCAAWDGIASALRRWVITYDQRGHGHSDHIGTEGFYHFFDYVSDLDGLIHQIAQPVDLLGHSMGGTIACLYAAIRPNQVRNLVLVEGVGPPDTVTNAVQRGSQFLEHRLKPPTHSPLESVEAAAARMRNFNHSLQLDEAIRLAGRHTKMSENGSLTWRWDSRHRSRSPRPFSAQTFKVYLQKIRSPTLLIFGDQSFYMTMPDLQERIDSFSNAELVFLEKIGHHPHQQCPNKLVALIEDHCKGPENGM